MKDLAGATLNYNTRMLPIILETTNEKARANFIEEFVNEQQIRAYNYFTYDPEGKELSIKQIREIIGETTFHSTEPRLFHIFKFDTASAEAQNAFLKTLEEHQPNLYFILSVEQSNRLLATIRSRSRIVKLTKLATKNLSLELGILVKALESGNLPSLFQITNKIGKADSSEFFDSLMSLYRDRLGSDMLVPEVLKMIIKQQNLLKHNHIDAQTTVDSTLISIYKIYNQ